MRLIFYEERCERAARWPIMLWHFYKLIWQNRRQCTPPMGPLECLSAARRCVHLWIWGRMEENEYLLIRERIKTDDTR